MGISPLRLFLSANLKLTTYSRFLRWSACVHAHRTTSTTTTHLPPCRSKSLPSASICAQSSNLSAPSIDRRCCSSRASSSAKKERPPLEFDEHEASASISPSSFSASGEDQTLPDILANIARDKRILRTYSDPAEAAEAAVFDDRRENGETVAYQISDKISDVQAFLKELDEIQRRKEEEEEEKGKELAKRSDDDDDDDPTRGKPLLGDRQRNQTPPLPPLPRPPGSQSYSPTQLSEEISIVIGRDVDRKRLDVNVQQVVDVIRNLDRRIEKQVPEVDNIGRIRPPKSRTPLLMSLKMWIPQQNVFAFKSALDLISSYLRLSKSRLTTFVAVSAVGGYFIAPFDFNAVALVGTIVGTTLCSSAANAINQLMEIPFDSQMARTRDRPLVRAQMSPLHALTFALVSASVGTTVLYFGANEIVAGLGLFNLLLYTCVYTPMKRFTIVNTWVGAVVGAIPPLMGWAAATGSLGPGSLFFAGVLYSWQFPHFNALSWNMRAEYSRAGYCMMSVTDPELCKRVALRHCIFLDVICLMAPVLDITTYVFACDSFFVNAIFTFYAWRFYRRGDAKSSRDLFKVSLVYLPVILMFLIISKKRSETEPKNKVDNFHFLSSLLGI